MTDYVPTLDDIEALVGAHPDKFSSPLQTMRSISSARAQGETVSEITAQHQYGDYLSNGGEPLSSDGAIPSAEALHDQPQGKAGCDCEAAMPCCVNSITLGCSHREGRLILPQEDKGDGQSQCKLVLVADQGGASGYDLLKVTLDRTPHGDCVMPKQMPKSLIKMEGGETEEKTEEDYEIQLSYPGNTDLGQTDIERFVNATKHTLFGDLEKLGTNYSLKLDTCSGETTFDSVLQVYPKLEWTAASFGYEIKGTYYTDFTFVPSVALTGKLNGTFGASTFSIDGKGESKTDPENHSKSLIPFLDKTLSKLQDLTGEGSRTSEKSTHSSISVFHKVNLGTSKFKLVEHPTDPAAVGIEANVTMGFAPLIGIEAKLDIIDALLTAANGVAPGFAEALRKAREVMAKGIGEKGSNAHLSAHAAITLTITGNLGDASVAISRKVNETRWSGKGQVSGSLEISIAAIVKAEGKAYIVESTFSASGSAKSKLTAALQTIPSPQTDKKLHAKVGWNGIKVNVAAEAKVRGFGVVDMSAQRKKEIPIRKEEVFYDVDF
ncbi:hypothetical protein CEW89_12310 [Celeribacter ethanolicus]|uniref:Uncharacterized protein n=1 Tax=Celeribacter ethanolicus TaxID=1758178 RepID=A0A291GD11_9RHOB|nr:hypothetical protein [Celeribacter ethanolicus]ATG48279.1 hypothetical protein CEW89_12310 [Celeribacter ethanolicus]